ncbi:uncharacterized protein LOC128222148 [Mya arenaria]|uniref:uncharacterized protein LOC128222148 n=1 Tax=Mya arenaria TaxID=6604 RepID=UPI0022E48059|nr:uncharacterized protein LOC128222148 [Mya arenaria]
MVVAKDARWLSHKKATTTLMKCQSSVFTSLEVGIGTKDVRETGLAKFTQDQLFVMSLHMMAAFVGSPYRTVCCHADKRCRVSHHQATGEEDVCYPAWTPCNAGRCLRNVCRPRYCLQNIQALPSDYQGRERLVPEKDLQPLPDKHCAEPRGSILGPVTPPEVT